MNFKKTIILALLTFFGVQLSVSQDFPVYDFEEFEHYLNKNDEKVYVINFWATWCRPCVKEMPAFNKLYDKYHDKNVEIILVSLDFGENLPTRINRFKNTHEIKSTIIILDDPDSNSWIERVDKAWSGAIPATLIYNKEKRAFYEQAFEFDELENKLHEFIK